jgi:hypothetical protein
VWIERPEEHHDCPSCAVQSVRRRTSSFREAASLESQPSTEKESPEGRHGSRLPSRSAYRTPWRLTHSCGMMTMFPATP